MGKRGPKRIVDEAKEKIIVEMFRQNIPVKKIALAIGLNHKTVTRTLKDLNLTREALPNAKPMELSEDRRLAMIAACKNGEGTENVAVRFGLSRSTLGKILREAGVSLTMGPARIVNTDQADEIIASFRAGDTEQEIADFFGVGRTTVQRTLERGGVVKPADRSKPRVSEEVKLKALYACVDEGATKEEAAEEFALSESTLTRLLRREGFSLPQGRPQSCELDHDAFEIITRESAYWMGFLFTDGGLSEDGYGAPALGVNIQIRDRGHVEKLRAFLKSTHAITYCEARDTELWVDGKFVQMIHGGPSVTFRVRSEKIVSDLIAHGMDWKKFDRDEISSALTSSADFWRGCVDGDGHIGYKKKSGVVELAGNQPLLSHFQTFLHRKGLGVPTIHPTASGIFKVSIAGNPAMKIFDLLYGIGGEALERKNNRAQDLRTNYPRRK